MTSIARFDLHVHSRHSPDSWMPIRAIVERLPVLGLQGFALTDHNTVAGHSELRELQASFPQFTLVPGIEVSTVEGHVLVYGVDQLPPVGSPLAATLQWVADHHGTAVLAHPFRRSHGVGRKWTEEAAVDAIETVNGHNSEVANARASVVAARRRLGVTGGSDAHDLAGVGRAVTEITKEITTVPELLSEVRAGHSMANGRPMTFADRVRLSMRTSALRLSRGLRPI